MSWVCKYCSTNNEDSESKCMVCDRDRREARTCTLTKTRVSALGLTGNVTIPADYNVIGEGAFKDRTDIYSVTLHADVTKIAREAFSGCTNLSAVSCPVTLSSVGVRAFYNCRSLPASARPRSRYTSDDAYGTDAPSRTAYTAPRASYTPSYTSSYTPRRERGGAGKIIKKICRIVLWSFIVLFCLCGFISILFQFI